MVTGEGQPSTARRTSDGVPSPRGARRDPDRSRRRHRGPGHQRVVGVGDHQRGRCRHDRVAPPCGEVAYLVAAIELIATQVQQHDGVGRGVGHHSAEPALVDLEHGGGVGAWPHRARRRDPGACWPPGRSRPRHDRRSRRRRASAWWWSCRWSRSPTPPRGRCSAAAVGRGRAVRRHRPPITLPDPSLVARDAAATARPPMTATLARIPGAFGPRRGEEESAARGSTTARSYRPL